MMTGQNDTQIVDFNRPDLCENTTPISCVINGRKVKIHGKLNWKNLLVAVVAQFIKENNPAINKLRKEPLSKIATTEKNCGNAQPFLADQISSAQRYRFHWVESGYSGGWVDVGFSVPNLVKITGSLCLRCGVDLNDVIISYASEDARKQETKHQSVSGTTEYVNLQRVDDTETKFRNWMRICGKADSTINNYVNILRSSLASTLQVSENGNVFACKNTEDFVAINGSVRALPEFARINERYHNSFSAALNAYSRFLESKKNGECVPKEHIYHEKQIVDFSRPDDYRFTDPVECDINGTKLYGKNWCCLYKNVCKYFLSKDEYALSSLVLKGGRSLLSTNKSANSGCQRLSNGMFVEVSYSIPMLVRLIGKVCRHCGIDLFDVTITYLSKKQAEGLRDNQPEMSPVTVKKIDDNLASEFSAVISEHFPNGIRPNSVIDLGKFKNFYKNAYGKDLTDADLDLQAVFALVGIRHGDKIYVISDGDKNSLVSLINRLVAEKNLLLYYDELFDIHAEFMAEIHIFSSALLKTTLLELFPSFSFSRSYFTTQRSVTIESEILRCFDNTSYLQYEQIKKMTPYIPIDKIKQILSLNDDYIWTELGTYTHTSKLEIDFDEWAQIEDQIETELKTYSFISLASIDIPKCIELNSELSSTAVKNGLFKIFLSDRYEKRGNIVTKKGIELNSNDVFKDYCLSRNSVTFSELTDFEKEINGNVHSQSLYIAYDYMIRVDKNTFVSDDTILFNIDETDAAIALFIKMDVISLRSVTSFISFPHIDGYTWNLYLLESYCRRFSRKFMFKCLSVNSKNVGAIYRKSANFNDYISVLASVVMNWAVPLRDKDVGDFLFENGYIAQRTSAVDKVITAARKK